MRRLNRQGPNDQLLIPVLCTVFYLLMHFHRHAAIIQYSHLRKNGIKFQLAVQKLETAVMFVQNFKSGARRAHSSRKMGSTLQNVGVMTFVTY